MSIDAAGSYNNRAFEFTFYGDRTIGADFFIYNMNTNELWNNNVYSDYAANNSKQYYYNGEEIDIHIGTDGSKNNKQFIWKTRVYEDVDLSNGKPPTNRLVTGTVKPNPYLSGTVMAIPEGYESLGQKYIYVTIDEEAVITLPSWIYVNDIRRIILEYNKIDNTTAQLRLKTTFPEYPAEGDAYTISPYNTSTMETISSNQIFIASGIAINGSDTDHRDLSGISITVNYPKTPQPCYYLGIGDDIYPITNYKSATGLVTLDTSSDMSSVEVGTGYTIYSSFVESPFFFFTTEPTPDISSITMVQDGEVVKCDAVLNSKSFVKYQYWEIYDVTDSSNEKLVETSEKMYLDDLEFVFRSGVVGFKYKAVLHIVTQSNWDVTATSSEITITSFSTNTNIKSFSYTVNTNRNSIQLNIKIENQIAKNGGIKILRYSDYSGIIEYIDTISFNSTKVAGSEIVFNDYKVVSDTKYKYYLICYEPTTTTNKNTMYNVYVTNNISTSYESYSIYALQEVAYERYDIDTDKRIDYDYMYAERRFKVLDIFRPELNVTEKHKINHNLGRDVYVGYSQKPSVSIKKTAYDTFSLSFQLGNTEFTPCDGTTLEDAIKYNLGYIKIVNTDIGYYFKLKNIIEESPPFLIKDYKGNIWFGIITSHNTEIDNSMTNDKTITVNIDFVETYPIEKVRIVE